MRKKLVFRYILPINIPSDYRRVQAPLCIGPIIFQCDVLPLLDSSSRCGREYRRSLGS